MASVEAAPRPHGESLICASSYEHFRSTVPLSSVPCLTLRTNFESRQTLSPRTIFRLGEAFDEYKSAIAGIRQQQLRQEEA